MCVKGRERVRVSMHNYERGSMHVCQGEGEGEGEYMHVCQGEGEGDGEYACMSGGGRG